MAVVISTINLKGGVGKTSLTVALCEFLASEWHKRVLLIDLDPQTNATVALMDEERWKQKDEKGETLLQLFKDRLEKTSLFELDRAVEKNVSNLHGGISGLDLLPSSLGLIEIQDQLPSISAGKFYTSSPVTILRETVQSFLAKYDFVFVDCPPNLGIITLNGMLISDYYVIPCIPDILSTYGIPQILNRISSFRDATQCKIEPLGIIISMYRSQSRLHRSVVQDLEGKATQANGYPRVFETRVPLSVKSAEAADFEATVNTLRQKYGYGNAYEVYSGLTRELLSYVRS